MLLVVEIQLVDLPFSNLNDRMLVDIRCGVCVVDSVVILVSVVPLL